jgi:isochorismate pyruvate lyase
MGVHGDIFRGRPPATTMVEVKALIDPAMMIEIEADAVVAGDAAGTVLP